MTKKFALALACLCLLPLKSFAMPSDPMGTTGGGDPSYLAFSDQFTGELAAITGAELDGQGTLVLKVAADSSTSDQTSVRRVPVKEVNLLSSSECGLNTQCRASVQRLESNPSYFQLRPSFLSAERAKNFPVIFRLEDVSAFERHGILKVAKTKGGELVIFFDLNVDHHFRAMRDRR